MDPQTIQTVLAAVAVIVAAVIAGVLGFYGNFRIKQLEFDAQRRKEETIKRLSFYLPLLRFCNTLDRRIGHILTTLDTDWLAKVHLDKIKSKEGFVINPNEKGYFISSSMYIFACFFGWSEAIKRGVESTKSFSTKNRIHKLLSRAKRKLYNFLHIPVKRDIYHFDPDLSVISKLFQYEELFDEYMATRMLISPRDACKLHKQIQYSIGELMLEKDAKDGYRCKSYREFFTNYVEDEKFRFWFVLLENLFIDLCGFESGKDIETQVQLKHDIRPLRLLAIRYWCRILMKNMSEYLDIETKPPEDVLEGISYSLKKTILSVKIEELESYLLEIKVHPE
jgi:hypothetical protein